AAGGVAIGRRAARGRAPVPVMAVTSGQPSATPPTRPPAITAPQVPELPRPPETASAAVGTPDHPSTGTRHAIAASGIASTPDHHATATPSERAGAPGTSRVGGTLGGSSPEALSGEARALLERAEEALRLNQPQEAIRLVDQSFFIQKSSRGYA